MLLQQNHAKEPTKIKITSKSSQYEGGLISIKLTDLNRTGISKEVVNITKTDENGQIVVDNVVKTDSNGKSKLDLELESGEYIVSDDGNENFIGNSTTQNLTITKEIIETSPYSSNSILQTDSSGESGESVVVEDIDEEIRVREGYKGGRKGVWTPTGNFIAECGS